MSAPLVSVVIPAYNAATCIGETLESVFAQGHRTLEVVVIDDGSTDATPQIVQAFRHRIQYIRQPNAGAGAARNRGFDVASGQYVALLDADDLWLPDKLEVQLEVAARNPGSGLIACDGSRFADGEAPHGSLLTTWVTDRLRHAPGELTGHFYPEFLRQNPITCPSQMLIPRHVITRIGPMVLGRDEAEDWDYALRIALEFPVTLHEHRLVRYRVHPQSRTGPEASRDFVWAFWDLRLYRRELGRCPPEVRPLVRAARTARVRGYAWAGYYHSRQSEPRAARRFLTKLLCRAPWEPQVAVALAASCFPRRVGDCLVRAWRRLLGPS